MVGMEIRFDKGDPNKPDWGAKGHYHITNPDTAGKMGEHLGKNGRPVAKHSNPSHILPEE
jgi:hypothetical protein